MSPEICALQGFDLISCIGKDAQAFLQAQLSNDVSELITPNAQWTSLFSPQGRTQALMLLFRIDDEAFVLAVPHRRGMAIVDLLRKFVLRRKLTLSLDTTHKLLGVRAEMAADPLTTPTFTLPDGRGLMLADDTDSIDTAECDWHRQDLLAGIPWLPEGAADKHLPHALGLDKLASINFKKGCYPGQEIVARTHYLGRNKRFLALLESTHVESTLGAGSVLRDEEARLAGELIDVCRDEHGTLALAVISEDRAAAPLLAITTDEQRIPFVLRKRF